MSRKEENQGFICQNCQRKVEPIARGSYRNHCNYCLYSLHLDEVPGDRSSDCHGIMRPLRIETKKKHWQIIHQCEKCQQSKANKMADDDEIIKFLEREKNE